MAVQLSIMPSSRMTSISSGFYLKQVWYCFFHVDIAKREKNGGRERKRGERERERERVREREGERERGERERERRRKRGERERERETKETGGGRDK